MMGYSSPMYCQVPNSLQAAAAAGSPNLRVLSNSSRQDSSISSSSRMSAHIAAAGSMPHVTSQFDAAHSWDVVGQAVAPAPSTVPGQPQPIKPDAEAATPPAPAHHSSEAPDTQAATADPAAGNGGPVIGQLEAATAAACPSAVADAQESEEIEHTLMWLQTADDQVWIVCHGLDRKGWNV